MAVVVGLGWVWGGGGVVGEGEGEVTSEVENQTLVKAKNTSEDVLRVWK